MIQIAKTVDHRFWNFRIASSPLPCLRWVILPCLFVLSVTSLGLMETVWGHSEVDPEIAEVTAELALQPGNVDLLLQRGRLYRINGKLFESLNDLDQSCCWTAKIAKPHWNVAALIALGRESEAEGALNQYLLGKLEFLAWWP